MDKAARPNKKQVAQIQRDRRAKEELRQAILAAATPEEARELFDVFAQEVKMSEEEFVTLVKSPELVTEITHAVTDTINTVHEIPDESPLNGIITVIPPPEELLPGPPPSSLETAVSIAIGDMQSTVAEIDATAEFPEDIVVMVEPVPTIPTGRLVRSIQDREARRREQWKEEREQTSDEAESDGRKKKPKRRTRRQLSPEEEKLEEELDAAQETAEAKFEPTPEMLKVHGKIEKVSADAEEQYWRITAYKNLDARTIKALQKLNMFFIQREQLEVELKSVEVKARREFADQQRKAREEFARLLLTPTTAWVDNRLLGGQRAVKVHAVGDIHQFNLEYLRLRRHLTTVREQERKRTQKEKALLWERNRRAMERRASSADAFSTILKDLRSRLAKGEIDPGAFKSRRTLLEKIWEGREPLKMLTAAFAAGEFSREELRLLKEAVTRKVAPAAETSPAREPKPLLREVMLRFARGEVSKEEFVARKKEFSTLAN